MDQIRIYYPSIKPSDIITGQRIGRGVKKEIPPDSKQISALSPPLSVEKSKYNNEAVDEHTLYPPPKEKESNFDLESQESTDYFFQYSRSKTKRDSPIFLPKSDEILEKRYYDVDESRTYNPMNNRKTTNIRDNNRKCHSVPKNISSILLYNFLYSNNNVQQNSSIRQMNTPEHHQVLFDEFSDQNSMKSVETYLSNLLTPAIKPSQSATPINDEDLTQSVLDNSVNSSVRSCSVPLSRHQPIHINQDLNNSNEKQVDGISLQEKPNNFTSSTEEISRKIHKYSVSDRTNALIVNIENQKMKYLNIKDKIAELQKLMNDSKIKGKTCRKCGDMMFSDLSGQYTFHICSKTVYKISTLDGKLQCMDRLCRGEINSRIR